jgi:hypothetical protein
MRDWDESVHCRIREIPPKRFHVTWSECFSLFGYLLFVGVQASRPQWTFESDFSRLGTFLSSGSSSSLAEDLLGWLLTSAKRDEALYLNLLCCRACIKGTCYGPSSLYKPELQQNAHTLIAHGGALIRQIYIKEAVQTWLVFLLPTAFLVFTSTMSPFGPALLVATILTPVFALNFGFPYGSTKVRGVNLGGWLVMYANHTTTPHWPALTINTL